MDLQFLNYCKLNNVTPNFVKFKLYRKALYNSDFYINSVKKLLNIEIRYKERRKGFISDDLASCMVSLSSKVSFIDFNSIQIFINREVSKYKLSIQQIHDKKLRKLGISRPEFLNPDNVVFNFSSHILSAQEKFLLSLGLKFCLPCFKPNFKQFFLPFELLVRRFKKFSQVQEQQFEETRKAIQGFSHTFFNEYNKGNFWTPFFRRADLDVLKALGGRQDLVVCRPDKGNGVVLLDRADYVGKMKELLQDETKFAVTNESPFKIVFRVEDKINRFLRNLLETRIISDETYKRLYSTGGSLCTLYGLPKIHKQNIPLRPILAGYRAPNYQLAKYLVPQLAHLTTNEYTIKNSYEFCDTVKLLNSRGFMVSLDVKSLFTNIPLHETIEIILQKLFSDAPTFNSFDKQNFRKLLELSVLDTYFIFDETVYKQCDGMAMGSPLGPSFANIFMCHLEEMFLEMCPPTFKPIFYRRYVDDTFVIFKEQDHATQFLQFVNSLHSNIEFTLESEVDESLPFLDVRVRRDGQFFSTEVFRKKTFSGQGINFYSFTSYNFKLNCCKTLINRAYKICSNWTLFNQEVNFLRAFFKNNGYPLGIFSNIIRQFLNDIFIPKLNLPTVPKLKMYFSFPYMGENTAFFKKELKRILSRNYTFVDFNFIFNNPRTIDSLFRFKDEIPKSMRAGVIYFYSCPKCPLGTYVGSTERMIKVRIDGHRGVSHRTGNPLTTKEFSSIRNHSVQCKANILVDDFKILGQHNEKEALLVSESLHIKELRPTLNLDNSSVNLYVV